MIETEGEHLTLRWAKALMNVAQKITIHIDKDSLLVGRGGPEGRYGILFPEIILENICVNHCDCKESLKFCAGYSGTR